MTTKLTHISAFLLLFNLHACEKIVPDPGDLNHNDTLVMVDSISKYNNCIPDTIYTCDLNEGAREIYDRLLDAFARNCDTCLERFLTDWEDESIPRSNIPDSLIDIYDVYREFYSPWDLARISESEFGNSIYDGIDHYIIQKRIFYDDSFRSFAYEHRVIENFRPTITNTSKHLLYFSEDYRSALNCFLGASEIQEGQCTVIVPDIQGGEIYDRTRFLDTYLRFFHGHWGNYWHYETHPEVEVISLNKARDSAQVSFRLGYQGGEVILGKEESGWVIVDHYMTWIE